MADEQRPPLPAPLSRSLDRAAMERVLARAAELQAHTAEPGESMTEQQLIELGKEVGITAEHLRQAIAEEQTRVAVPTDTSGIGGLFGPPLATASRIVHGSPAAVLAKLDQWMLKEECLQVKRRYTDRITWEARRDFLGNIKRGFNLGGRGYALTRAAEVAGTVVPIDENRALVRLDADLGFARRRSVGWGSASAGGGLLGAAGLVAFAATAGGSAVLAAVIGGVWAIAGVGGFVGLAAGQRKQVARAQLALEQVLDRLEHPEQRGGGGAASLIEAITSAVAVRNR